MKILVLRLSSLGDIVLIQPVLAALRERWPEAQIDCITKPAFGELIPLMGCEVRPLSYAKTLAFHLALRAQQYDLVVDLHGKFATWLLRMAAAGKTSSVYSKRHLARLQIVKGNRDLRIKSTLDLYFSALTKLRIPFNPDLKPKLYAPEDIPLPEIPEGKQLIFMFPGAAHYTKMYPESYWKDILVRAPQQYHFWLCGSHAEWELCNELHEHSPANSTSLAGELKFPALVAALAKAEWVLSGDSGPMHLAAALGVKQIAIFGATHPRLGFAPLNDNATILSADLPCQPCSLHGGAKCPLGHFRCMRDIDPQRILDIIK